MERIIAKIKYKASFQEEGVTLIELLSVIMFMSILSYIAMSFFLEYQQRGYDAATSQDVRLIATAQEAFFVDNAEYLSCADRIDCIDKLDGVNKLSEYSLVSSSGDIESFNVMGQSARGTGRTYSFTNYNGMKVANNQGVIVTE